MWAGFIRTLLRGSDRSRHGHACAAGAAAVAKPMCVDRCAPTTFQPGAKRSGVGRVTFRTVPPLYAIRPVLWLAPNLIAGRNPKIIGPGTLTLIFKQNTPKKKTSILSKLDRLPVCQWVRNDSHICLLRSENTLQHTDNTNLASPHKLLVAPAVYRRKEM